MENQVESTTKTISETMVTETSIKITAARLLPPLQRSTGLELDMTCNSTGLICEGKTKTKKRKKEREKMRKSTQETTGARLRSNNYVI